MGGLLVFILEIFHGIRHPLSRAGSCCKNHICCKYTPHIVALTTRFRELDGEAKSIIKSLLAVVVKVAGMPAGLTDDVYPFTTNLICSMAVVPPNTQLSLGIPCSHGSCPWVD